jgi:hypothetical protein
MALAQLAHDTVSFAELWSPPFVAIERANVIDMIVKRIDAERGGAAKSGSNTLALAKPSVIGDELLDSMAHAINNKHIRVDRNEAVVARLLQCCDSIEKQSHPVDDESSSSSSSAQQSTSKSTGSSNDEYEDIEHSSKYVLARLTRRHLPSDIRKYSDDRTNGRQIAGGVGGGAA